MLGALVGGYTVKRFDLKFRGMMKFVLASLSASFLLTFTFMINCPNPPFAGVTVEYENGYVVPLSPDVLLCVHVCSLYYHWLF